MLQKHLNDIQDIIEKYNINLINLIFIGFTIIIVIFGSLMSFVESYLPTCIRQSFRYGKHSHKGVQDKFVSKLEVPKGWFKHFYTFAFPWSVLALLLILKSFIFKTVAPEYVLQFLDFMAGGRKNRQALINSNSALVASVLMTLQCARRFYETNFVQIFSKKSKMNLSHYIVGYLHYFGAILALLANTEGFVRGTLPSEFSFKNLTLLQYISIFLFHFSWRQQYKANIILVNLRKDQNSGKFVSERHLMPVGGFFEYISSPHMFFEISMYLLIFGLLPDSNTWAYVVFWVLSNQSINALLTHRWYKENFKNYPRQRYALIPFIL